MTEAPLEFSGLEDVLPLSPSQEGMLLQSVANPGRGYYLGVIVGSLPEGLDRPAFERAWQQVIDRHQALRSTLVWETLDTPVQLIAETSTLQIEERDWSDRTSAEAEAALDDLISDLRRTGLDISSLPAMRGVLIGWPGGGYRFCWLVHHALLDDWSVAVVLQEVGEFYAAATATGAVPILRDAIPVRALADWLAGQDNAATEAWWTDKLAGPHAEGRLPFDAPVDAGQDGAGPATLILERQLSPDISRAVSASLVENRLTLGAAIAAVWAAVLGRLLDRDEVIFGVATTMRPAEIEGIDRAVGNFVTTLPAGLNLAQFSSMRALIADRMETGAAAHENASLSLTRLKTLLGVSPKAPIFESIVSLKSTSGAGSGKAVLFDSVQSRLSSGFPLAMIVEPGDAIGIRLIADGRRIGQADLPCILDMVAAGLAALPDSMDRPPQDLPVLANIPGAVSEPDFGDISELGTFGLVHEEILARAEERPDATAVAMGERSVTYRELVEQARSVAVCLGEKGIGPGDSVAILISVGPDAFVAMLGALLAGATYVPLNAEHPDAHVLRILEHAGVRVVLTDRQNAERVERSGRGAVVVGDLGNVGGDATLPEVPPDSPAYLLFTSGSTGTPKGVLVSHRNLSASTEARLAWYKETPEAFLLLSSIAFDSSVAGIYWTLCTGGTLVLAEPDAARDPFRIGTLIQARFVTHTLCLPSLYKLILEASDAGALVSLQTVIVAGEAVSRAIVHQHRQSGVTARLVNEYGPTEATVWCSACDLGRLEGAGPVPIGRAIPGSRLMIRDSRHRPVPPGMPGELWVGGAGVSLGYLDLPEATAERFVEDPTRDGGTAYRTGDRVRRRADGMFEYLGRIDRQVKVRGVRIEPTLIETLLMDMPEVREAAVDARGEDEARALVAWIVGEPENPPEIGAVAAHLAEALPAAMVPSQLLMVDELPRTSNGKIDYRALAAPTAPIAPAAIVPPSSETEKALAEIWKRVLWLEREIGLDEDFFELGGHSLAAMRLITEIGSGLGLRIPVARLGRLTTIRDQAMALDAMLADADAEVPPKPAEEREPETQAPSSAEADPLGGLVETEQAKLHAYLTAWPDPVREGSLISVLNRDGTLPPLFFWFTARADFERLSAQLGPDQPVYGMRAANGVIPSRDTDLQISAQHRVARHYLRDILDAYPSGPFYLGGHCQGGIVALNVANMLLNLRRPVATLILVQKEPPIPYAGHVDLIVAQHAMTNPYGRFARPEETWDRLYRSWTVDSLPCGYSDMYWGRNERLLAGKIRDRLEQARRRGGWPLPRGGHLLEWGDVNAPEAAARGAVFEVDVSIRNLGQEVWAPSEQSGLFLVSRAVTGARPEIARIGHRTPLHRTIAPGERARVLVAVRMPDDDGEFSFELDIVEEGISHFSDRGAPVQSFVVRSTPSDPLLSAGQDADPAQMQLEYETPGQPDPLADYVRRIRHFRTAGNAAGGLDIVTSEAPNYAVALIEEGLCALEVGNVAAAASPLLAAARLAPKDPWAAFALGRLRHAQSRPIAAALQMMKAKRLSPDAELATLVEYHLARMNAPRRWAGKLVDTIRPRNR
ncbi:non-ribosomal peptide synthetase [Tropicimonas aquimaris]|uniref:Amino acid adenylation domain-containing protein n=1 Tax=Tropicimonas aquimaris TaxID=914152 RepID=A0ABW3IY01_9RHOB